MAKNEVSVKINFIGDVNNAVSSINRLKTHLSNLKINSDSAKQLDTVFNQIINKQKELQNLQNKESFNKKDIDAIKQLEAELEGLQKTYLDIAKSASKGIMSNADAAKVENITNSFKKYKQQVDEAQKSLKEAEQNQKNYESTLGKAKERTDEQKQSLKGYTDAVEKCKNELQETSDKALKDFKEALAEIAKIDKIEINTDDLKEFKDAETWIDKYAKSLSNTKLTEQQIIAIRHELESVSKKYNLTLKEGTKQYEEQTQAARELDQINSRLTSFFSVASGVRLLSKAVKDSISTIKELDEVMTQAAVVTNYDVNDMWEKLPEFTKQANQLGVATKEAYSAMTLYVQQGLDLNTATSLATETLKMARIASLDASTATDRVTNAIRAFNMEINEDSARRVADVYSNLAAKSASNVNELSVAMTKVASIASSANMSFEKTAAFLAQGIETTRESAETIGTMLKTVVGRIGEVKKLYSQGDLAGTDENGEAIDVNKVSKAFRTAGINLNEFFLGQKGLDDILMELAEKWNTLDLVHQRYIATQAAGSRQQSRFIALLQDYARTQELVSYAENAAGASNEQYEKTLDSIESKLNQLKNAWDSFTMGIANNKLVKGGVDTLTGFLNIINNLTSKLGTTGGLIAKLALAFTGFFGGGQLIRTLVSSFTSAYAVEGSKNIGVTLGTNILTGMKTLFSKDGLKSIGNVFAGANITEEDKTVLLKKIFNGKRNLYTDNWIDTHQNDSSDEINAYIQNSKDFSEAEKNLASGIIKGKPSAEFDQQKKAVLGLATACGLGAMALGGLAKAAEAAGNTKLASALQTISTVLGVLVPVLSLIPPILDVIQKKGVAAATIPLGPILIIVAAIAAVVAIIKIVNDLIETSAEKTERLKNTYNEMTKAAEEAKQSYDNLKSSIEDYHSAKNGIDQLIEGTKEFNEALIEVNSQVIDLIEKYPKLAQYLQRDSNGLLSINESGFEEILAEQQQFYLNAASASLGLSIAQNQHNITSWGSFQGTVRDFGYGNVTNADEKVLRNAFEQAYQNSPVPKQIAEELRSAGYLISDQNVVDWVAQYETYLNNVRTNDIIDEATYRSLISLSLKEGSDSTYASAATASVSQRSIKDFGQELQNIVDTIKESDTVLKEEYKSLYNQETDLVGDELKTAIAVGRLTAGKADDAEVAIRAFDALADKDKQQADTLSQILTSSLTEAQLDKFQKGGLKALGLKPEDIGMFAQRIGIAADELDDWTQSLIQNAKLQIEQNKQKRVELQASLIRSGLTQGNVYQLSADLSIEDVDIVQGALDHLNSYLSDGLSTEFTNNLVDGLTNGSIKAEDIDWLNDWNTNNAVNAAEQLRKKIAEITDEEGNALEGKEQLFNAYNELLKDESISTSRQLSQVYEEITEDLDKLINKGKEIDSDAIKDLAKDGSALEKMLNSASVSAEGLARIFSAIKSGGISSFDGVTARVLEAISSVTSLDDSLKDAFERLSGFKEFDRQEGMDTLKSLSDKTKEYIDNYEYGNASDILKFFYGEDYYKSQVGSKTGDARNVAIRELGSQMQHLTSNEGYNALWQAAQNNGQTVANYDLKVSGGKVTFDVDKIKQGLSTAEDIAKDLAKDLNISEDAAMAVVGAFTSHNDELEDVLNQNSLSKALKKLAEQSEVITNEEAKALAAGFGLSLEDVESKIKDLENEGIKLKVITLFDEDGVRVAGKELHKAVEDAFGGQSASLFKQFSKDGIIDATAAGTYFSGLGLDQAQIDDELNYLAERFHSKLSAEVVTGVDEAGNVIVETVTSDTTEGLSKAIEQAQKEADANILAQNIGTELAKAFDDIDFKSWGKQMAEGFKEGMSKKGSVEGSATGAAGALSSFQQIVSPNIQFQAQTGALDNAKAKLELLQQLRDNLQNGIRFTTDNSQISNSIEKIKQLRAQLDALSQSGGVTVGAKTSKSKVGTAGAIGGSVGKSEEALTGELGTEIVVRGNQWFTVGDQGPEMANLKKGDIVFNANQTRDLLTKGRTPTRGRALARGTAYAETPGYWKLTDPVPNGYGANSSADAAKSAASAASSAKDAADIWMNTLDKLYNLVQLIEEETRRRELLEREFERIQRNQNQTLSQIRDNYEAQLESLTKSLEYQRELQKGRLAQINAVANERYKMDDKITTYAGSGATKYARYNQQTNTIQIDWDAIDKITDKNLGEAVEAYISRLEELQDQFEDTYSVLCDIEDEIYDLNKAYREAYQDFANRVHDALVSAKQQDIDRLSDFSSSLANEQKEILDALNEQIEIERRIRDNTEKESEIADKEQQLAYLRRDTSSGNQKAIKQLEKEISDLRDDYRDTLIDQKLDELQNENEKAQAAREKQIELLQAQLDYDKEHGAFWATVESLMMAAFNPDGTMSASSDLVKLLQDTDSFKAMSDVAQDSWMLDLAAAFQMGSKGLENWKVAKVTAQAQAQDGMSITTGDGTILTYNKESGKWEAAGSQYDLNYNATTGQFGVVNGEKIPVAHVEETPAAETPSSNSAAGAQSSTSTTKRQFTDEVARGIAAAIWIFNDTGSGWDYDGVRLTQKFGAAARAKVQSIINAQGPNGQLYNYWASRGYDKLSEYRYSAFKSGGLVNFTGPAWLDGSKTSPEMVLSAVDTQNFMRLVDVLEGSGINGAGTVGNNYFQIEINVDELGSDYDVERLAEKLKDEIYRNAQYRNVNALNFIR